MGLLSRAKEPEQKKETQQNENVQPISSLPSESTQNAQDKQSNPIATDSSVVTSSKVVENENKNSQDSKEQLSQSLENDLREKMSDRPSNKDVTQNDAIQALLKLQVGEQFRTQADDVYELVQKNKAGVPIVTLSRQLQMNISDVKKIIDILYRQKLFKVKYPMNIFSSPVVKIEQVKSNVEVTNSSLGDKKTRLEAYTVQADNVVADVNIWAVANENTPIYQILSHKLSGGSSAIVDYFVDVIAEKITITTEDINNPKRVVEMRSEFFKKSLELVESVFSNLDEQKKKFLAGIVVHKTYGLGDIEILMSDNWLEEIAINGSHEPVSVYHKRYGWLKTTTFFDKQDQIYNFASQISRRVGKQINALNPIMDAHLQTGDRVAATLFPVSTEGDTITIRRFSRNPWTVAHMIDPKVKTMSAEVLALLWEAVQYELNFMVVGGTASGKTSVLNTLAALIPPTNRIISIEDTREITLPEALHWNWVPLTSRSANTEGQGEVTMLDLMVASLRMRPDRIIVGEIRRKQQAEALFEAMHTGHSVCATMHADTAEQIKRRLTQPPIDIPENEIQALHMVVVQYRDRRRGVRRTLEVAELLPGTSGEKINLNYLFRWRPRSDEFVKDNDSIRIVEDLNLHTGMTQNELEEDLHQKKEILEWIARSNIRDVDKIGTIMSVYYKYPDIIMDTIKDNKDVNKLF